MSESTQSEAVKSEELDGTELVSSEKAVAIADELSTNLMYEKQQLFVEKANSTFRELCKTLENEQNKLSELEARRKTLQEEMLLLRGEIEEEMKSLNVNIERSVAEKLNALHDANSLNDKLTDENQTLSEDFTHTALPACDEEENHQPVTARSFPVKSGQNILEEDTLSNNVFNI